jgi:uncharacterized protein YaaN involved in tellurite resistance
LAEISGRGAAVFDEQNGSIGRSLDELRRWARELAPVGEAGSARPGRRFGIFPGRDATKAYERRWFEAQQALVGTVARLHDAVTQLRGDNAVVAEEQLATETQIGTISDYAELARELDERLSSMIETLHSVDVGRADILRSELLFGLRQRRQQILTQLTVAMQARAALRIIEENNLELIDAITSTTNGTLAVLQTGATVRQALEVRRRLQAGIRRRATEDGDGGKQIPEAEALQHAWADVGETLNQVERLRRQVNETAAMFLRSDLR